MKRATLVSLAVLALTALSASFPAMAAKPAGNGPELDLPAAHQSGYTTPWIEQEDDWPRPNDGTAITNTTGCLWSINDQMSWFANGALAPGAVSAASFCVVSDFDPAYATRYGTTGWWSNAVHGFVGFTITPGLRSVICFQPQGRCFSPSNLFCGHAHYLADDPILPEIPNTNGGHGVITIITITVSNPSSKRVRDIAVTWGFSSDSMFSKGCEDQTGMISEYPFAWRSG